MQCIHCDCARTKSNGHSPKGVQRYLCHGCGKTFTQVSDKRKMTPILKEQVLFLRTNGKSLRAIALQLGHSKTAIWSFLATQ